MRVNQHPSSRRRSTEFRRKMWAEFLGGLLREVRLEKGRSVVDAARAAGMEADAWEAVEAGQVPKTWAEICRMTDALGVDRTGATSLVLMCQEAWD